MGCKCDVENKLEIQNEIRKNNNNDNKDNKNILEQNHQKQVLKSNNNSLNLNNNINEDREPQDDYSKEIFKIINNIRTNPKLYADEILNKKTNIIKEKDKIIYKEKIKVSLCKGEECFVEAANICKNMDPLSPFIFDSKLCLQFPDDIDSAKSKDYLPNQVRKMEDQQNIIIGTSFKELVKIPHVSALLMIVDDNIKNSGKKRKALLSENYKYIGITSKFYGKYFIAYFCFKE